MSGPVAADGGAERTDRGGDAGAPERGGWELGLLLAVAALLVLPELFDVDAFKTAGASLVAGAVLLPVLLVGGRADVLAWATTPAAWLLAGATALALPAARGALGHAVLTDRVLGLALAQVAAVLGLRAARRAPTALVRALLGAGLAVAVVSLLQAVGIERVLTGGTDEVVATFGNSTRAGLALAYVVVAAFATLLAPAPGDPHWRERFASAVLNLGFAALLLTRARGGWLAAGAGLFALAATSAGRFGERWRAWGVPLGVGLALALVLGDGPARLFAPKLPADAALVTTGDVTGRVRLSIWRGTLAMVADAPLGGIGLGRFREAFPAYRDPAEAALPGREGLPTEVDHPHNELLLPLAEGGWPAGLLVAAFLGWTLARGARRARPEAGRPAPLGDRVAFGLLVAGAAGALVQNAWTTPGTALPFFAAVGWAWRPRPRADRPAGPPRPARATSAGIAAMLAVIMAGLLLLALPRAAVHVNWWRFFRRADVEGIDLDNARLLVRAADADPGDVDIQRRLLVLGGQLRLAGPQAAAFIDPALDRARERLAELEAGPGR